MNWRIYRLPGSREWWLIDHGPGSLRLACTRWEASANVRMHSEAGDPSKQPREWIWVSQSDLYLMPDVVDPRSGKTHKILARFEGPSTCV
jgi:hypothetical protein